MLDARFWWKYGIRFCRLCSSFLDLIINWKVRGEGDEFSNWTRGGVWGKMWVTSDLMKLRGIAASSGSEVSWNRHPFIVLIYAASFLLVVPLDRERYCFREGHSIDSAFVAHDSTRRLRCLGLVYGSIFYLGFLNVLMKENSEISLRLLGLCIWFNLAWNWWKCFWMLVDEIFLPVPS